MTQQSLRVGFRNAREPPPATRDQGLCLDRVNVIVRAVLGSALICAVLDFEETATAPAASVVLADDTYSYLPLAGRPLVDGVRAGKDCLALLPHLVRHPNWTIGIVETEWTVLGGAAAIASFDIAADGEVSLERLRGRYALPHRRFYLTEHELAAIRLLNGLSCSEKAHPVDHARTFHVSYSGFPDPAEGAAIPADSQMGAMIDRILRTAAARYLPARIEVARRIQLALRIASSENGTYRITVADSTLVVKRGTQELLRRTLTADELVDLADWVPPNEWDGGDVSGHGWARGSLFDGAQSRQQIVFDAAWLSSSVPNLGPELSDLIERDE
jgi:hypothetical protein